MKYVGAISDTDILINLASVNRFDILECLFEQIIIPQFVYDVEIKRKAGRHYSTIVQAINKKDSVFKILDRKKDEALNPMMDFASSILVRSSLFLLKLFRRSSEVSSSTFLNRPMTWGTCFL